MTEIQHRLDEVIKAVLVFMNTLEIERLFHGYDAKKNPFFADAISITYLLAEPTDEPGLTPSEITEISHGTEISPHEFSAFTDGYSDFFESYGMRLVHYDDTGEIYLFIEDSKIYLQFLVDAKTLVHHSKNLGYLLRKIDHACEEKMKTLAINYGSQCKPEIITSPHSEWFDNLEAILNHHELLDPSPPSEHGFLRKRLRGHAQAFHEGYFNDRMILADYLPIDEIGARGEAQIRVLKNYHDEVRCFISWKIVFDILRAVIRIQGKNAQSIIQKVLENLKRVIDEMGQTIIVEGGEGGAMKNHPGYKLFNYAKQHYDNLSSIELGEPIDYSNRDTIVRHLTPKEKMDSVIKLINSYFFTSKELGILKRRIKKIKRRTDFPF